MGKKGNTILEKKIEAVSGLGREEERKGKVKKKRKKKKENWRVIGRREGNFSCCIPSLWLERGLTEDGEKIKERKRNKGM